MTKKILLVLFVLVFTLASCSNSISQKEYNALLTENEQLKQRLSQYETISSESTTTSAHASKNEKELIIDEWIHLSVSKTEIQYKFEGFTPIQDKDTFGTYVMMLCSIENVSDKDYDAYYFFENNVKITDADGFSLVPSSYGWDYNSYGCDTSIKKGEKKKIVKAFAYSGEVSDLTVTISDDENEYIYMGADSDTNSTSATNTSCKHVWSEATINDPSFCTVCGEENLFGWSISTEYIMGTWNAEYYYCDGEISSGKSADFEARFITDGTGYMKLDGDTYSITWQFSEEVDTMIIYKVKMNGDTRQIGYVTDTKNDFYHKLMFELEDNLYVVLKKVA